MTEETPLAARFAQQKASIGRLAETVAGMAEATLWTSLTCQEVEAIAEVLRSDGWKETADLIVRWHSTGDEPGDLHFVRKHTVLVQVGWRGDLGVNAGDLILGSLLENFDHAEILPSDHPQ